MPEGARRASCLAQPGQFPLGGEEERWGSGQQNSQAVLAGLDQGKLDQEAAIRDLPLPHKAGLQTAGRFPPPAPSLGQGDSAPHLPHLVPAGGPSSPHHGIHGLFILPQLTCNTDIILGLGHPPSFPPLPCPVHPCPLFIYWAGGGVRAQADSLCPGARVGGHSNHGLFLFPWLGVDL